MPTAQAVDEVVPTQIYLNELYRNAERKDLIRHSQARATNPLGEGLRLAFRQERATVGRNIKKVGLLQMQIRICNSPVSCVLNLFKLCKASH